jgi:hypothetical protein
MAGRRTTMVMWQTIIPYLAHLLQSRIIRRATAISALQEAQRGARGGGGRTSTRVEAGEGALVGGGLRRFRDRLLVLAADALPVLSAIGLSLPFPLSVSLL